MEPVEAPVTPDEEIVLEQAPAATLEGIVNLAAFEPRAHRVLSPAARAYIAGAAGDEITLENNITAFRQRRLRPRVLIDVANIDPSTTVLDDVPLSLPVGLAPTGFNRLAHSDAEPAAARAAAGAGALFCLSTFSSCSIEEVAEAGGRRWFQLYVFKDRALSEEMLRRARDSGYSAVVFTVDLPVAGYREREMQFADTLKLEVGNLDRDLSTGTGIQGLAQFELDQSMTWSDIAWVAEVSGLPVVVKGILTGEDAALAVEHGASGIIVSNHGGRQLDRSPATIDVLEECVAAVGDRAEVYLDGGVRRGTDVVTALALGARAVFIGRPYLYALATGGEAGVARALEILKAELENAMALLGARTPSELSRAHVYPPPEDEVRA